MCLKTRRRSSSRSKSKNVSSTASPLDLSGTRATSQSRSDDGQTPKCSIRRILGFKRKKASTCNNPSSNIQKAESPPPASTLPTFPTTGIASDIPPLAHIPDPTVSPPPSPPAAPVSPPSVFPAAVPPTPPTSSPTPILMPEKTVSPPPSLPAAIVFPHPIPPAAVPPSYPTSLTTPESAATVSAPSVSPEVALPYSGTDVPPPAYIQPKESSFKGER